MDWHSWLSRSNLEPSVANEFGLVFSRNELQKEDMMYFNHEFLQTLGISVAKHRLEILSLVNKELGIGRAPNALKFGMFISAFNKTKKFFTKKWVSNSAAAKKRCSGKLRRINSAKEHKAEKSPVVTCKTVTKSGPIDRRMVEQMRITDKWSISLSGPLDMKIYQDKGKGLVSANQPMERHGHTDGKWRIKTFENGNNNNLSNYRPWQGRTPSPLFNHYHGNQDYSPWSMMFQDLKPT